MLSSTTRRAAAPPSADSPPSSAARRSPCDQCAAPRRVVNGTTWLLDIHHGFQRRWDQIFHFSNTIFAAYDAAESGQLAPIDTAACALVGRVMANHHRRRAQRLWLELPDPDGPEAQRPHHRYMAERAQHDADLARRWAALASRLLGT